MIKLFYKFQATLKDVILLLYSSLHKNITYLHLYTDKTVLFYIHSNFINILKIVTNLDLMV